MCMDKGYDFDEVRILLRQFHFVPHIRSGGEEVQCMKKSPRWRARRWVVERTHSWMNRFTRLSSFFFLTFYSVCELLNFHQLTYFKLLSVLRGYGSYNSVNLLMNYPAARPRGIKTILTAVAPPLAYLDFSRSFPLPANFRVPPPWRHSNRLSKTPLPIALSSPSVS